MNNLKWMPKINPAKLISLYRNYMLCAVDETEVDNVGLALYLRCHDILLISEGICRCPDCGTEFPLHDGLCYCAGHNCSFAITHEEYAKSWRHKDLCRGNALSSFTAFCRNYPLARGIDRKMILIDTLIHSFHMDLKAKLPNRAVGNNLIEGSLKQVVDVLDRLSGVQPDNDTRFKQTAQAMWKRRRGL